MASGPHFDRRRGTYQIQWHNGRCWTRSTVWRLRDWRPGSPRPKKDPAEAVAALAAYAAREKAARQGRALDPGLGVGAFLEAYRASYGHERAAGSARQLDQSAKVFLAWCATVKILLVTDVTPGACQRFLGWRARQTSAKTGKPITPRRLAQERALLSGAWRRAVRLRELAENPWGRAEVPGLERARKAGRPRRPSWSPEEFARLLAASRLWLRDILTLGVQTGIRISALLALEWRDVHWPTGEIEVRPELDKSGKGYRVPMSRACRELLLKLKLRGSARGEVILRGHRGKPTRLTTTATAIIRACERAGLPVPRSPNHHMRRTFGRWAIMGHLTGRPIPLYVVSRWYGHASITMTEAYLDLRQEESRDWMEEHR